MAYNVPVTQTTGDLITTATWNAEVVDNVVELAKGGFTVILDGGGATLSTDLTIDITAYNASQFTLTDVTLVSTDTGDLTLDLMVPAITSNAAAASDSIVAASPPAFSCDSYYHDGTLTGWTKQVAAAKKLTLRVTACTAVTKATFGGNYTRSS